MTPDLTRPTTFRTSSTTSSPVPEPLVRERECQGASAFEPRQDHEKPGHGGVFVPSGSMGALLRGKLAAVYGFFLGELGSRTEN